MYIYFGIEISILGWALFWLHITMFENYCLTIIDEGSMSKKST